MLELAQLKNIKLLSQLPDKDISKILPLCTIRPFKKDEIIFEYNQKITSIYMILDGEIEFYLPIKNGKKITIHRAQKGETFGISSILPEDCKTIFSAIGFRQGNLIEIDSSELMKLCNEEKELGYLFFLNTLKIYNQKKVRQNMMLIKSILSHREIKKIVT